ncbi:MAG: D-alanine--D-alanine ligase [bacterium]
MNKLNIAVIFGSRSTEHDVSIITGINSIIKPLELSGEYNVIPVFISKDGNWYSDDQLKDLNNYSSGHFKEFLGKLKPISLSLNSGLKLVKTGLKNKIIDIDLVFPATHGTHGEDGELMAICEMAGVAYVGCDVRSSAVAMDKVIAKNVAMSNNIDTAKFVYFSKHDFNLNPKIALKKIESELKLPVFVKPAHLGSSIGITRVTKYEDVNNAIEVALHYDDKVLIEEAVNNLVEVTLPIIGNEELKPAFLEQPVLHSEDFFDFDTKYLQGGKKGKNKGSSGSQGYSTIPAKLPKALYDKAEATGLAVYRAIGCSGIARVDMLIDTKTEKVYFNEVNPLPGGLYSHNWNKAGINNIELVSRLVDLAVERFTEKKSLETVFKTNYLSQFK